MGPDIKFVKFVELQRSECEIRHIRSAGASVQGYRLLQLRGDFEGDSVTIRTASICRTVEVAFCIGNEIAE
jgi:hypothetical protein